MSFVNIQPTSQSITVWAQTAGLIASASAYAGLNVSPNDITAIIFGIQALVAVITIIRKTFFTTTISPLAAAKL